MGAFDDFSVAEKVRFETVDIFDREVDFRIEFTPREFNTLMGLLDVIDRESEKAKKSVDEKAQTNYEKAVGEALSILVRSQEDREYMKSTVINIDPEATKFLSLAEFMKIIRLCLKADSDRLASETKKAEDGENIS